MGGDATEAGSDVRNSPLPRRRCCEVSLEVFRVSLAQTVTYMSAVDVRQLEPKTAQCLHDRCREREILIQLAKLHIKDNACDKLCGSTLDVFYNVLLISLQSATSFAG